jgi:hypothetical protein
MMALVCFKKNFTIVGQSTTFKLAQSGGNTALQIVSKIAAKKNGHGTIISA